MCSVFVYKKKTALLRTWGQILNMTGIKFCQNNNDISIWQKCHLLFVFKNISHVRKFNIQYSLVSSIFFTLVFHLSFSQEIVNFYKLCFTFKLNYDYLVYRSKRFIWSWLFILIDLPCIKNCFSKIIRRK